jgi:hypothetical protein
MIVIASKYLVPKGYTAITIFPFIFVRNKIVAQNQVLLNHERIHLRQQTELLILPFYLWYVAEYCIRLIIYKNKRLAYLNISFEREAYANESNHKYLERRGFWNFIKYLRSDI